MKKHKLLREDILPAMASNRKVQRLLNEFMDLLSEYKTTTTTTNLQPPTTTTTGNTNSPQPLPDQTATEPPMTNQVAQDSGSQPMDEEQPGNNNPAASDQMDVDPPGIEKYDAVLIPTPVADEMAS